MCIYIILNDNNNIQQFNSIESLDTDPKYYDNDILIWPYNHIFDILLIILVGEFYEYPSP